MAGVYFAEGAWHDEPQKLIGPEDHSFWLGSSVFDGARSMNGCAPDIEPHCQRLHNSAVSMGLVPTMEPAEVVALCREGVRKMPQDSELYIRPMYYATTGFVVPDPEGTKFCLSVYDAPMPGFTGFKVHLSRRRRPAQDMAITEAKAGALYPNSSRALREAMAEGYDNAIIMDANGNVAEFATANLWIVKDGVAYTPALNGTFLAGVTRKRIAELLAEDGTEVVQTTLSFDDVMKADEVFSSGNYGKVQPVTQVEDRDLQPGPVARKAYDLYMDYAKGHDLFA
ncbi:MAG: branched-chain amino acid aminotransferase [Alphaproteobacteria bacterium]|jgi:branched-chain amino acid aminotransferase|nr:branched-chain amino acid aminotransferase [Alphaproteobacteria bacterium]MBT4085654.1 branched-chain amino acid aminotransferase [Alphaproteobacteria bacterium]MBT4542728.1 branched-chain amino acid aminotransferase [Alphaproteobacteria bacterium]MBT7745866.1 branched-chain amino acid aminotransferase [Alphaproteobacteria bacterium]